MSDAGIATGSLTGGLVLRSAGATALPRTAPPLIAAAPGFVVAGRRWAFPGRRGDHGRRGVPVE